MCAVNAANFAVGRTVFSGEDMAVVEDDNRDNWFTACNGIDRAIHIEN